MLYTARLHRNCPGFNPFQENVIIYTLGKIVERSHELILLFSKFYISQVFSNMSPFPPSLLDEQIYPCESAVFCPSSQTNTLQATKDSIHPYDIMLCGTF